MALEIERKYIILKPELDELKAYADYSASYIVQTYLLSPDGVTHRVRMRKYDDRVEYTETKKLRLDSMTAEELERTVTEAEYQTLLERKDPIRTPIEKTRMTLRYRGQLFEIDIYPQWQRCCVLETELEDRDARVEFPKEIKILAEVTADCRFSNASMAKSFPDEPI